MSKAVLRVSIILGLALATVVAAFAFGPTLLSVTQAFETPLTRVAVIKRDIIFRDGAEGSIAVYDAGAQTPFDVLPREKNHFMATAMRLLAQERVWRSGAGRDTPFTLIQWSDGRLSLTDPATGESLELSAFGPTNAQTFAQLLPQRTPKS